MGWKDFKKWHPQKGEIHNERPRVFFNEREVWFCCLGENVGFEQDGRGNEFLRPIVILKKFNNEVFLSIPFTTKPKDGHPYYYPCFSRNETVSFAILSQIRLLDAKRLKFKIGYVSKDHFEVIKTKIRQMFA